MKTSNENDEGLSVAICTSLSFPFCHFAVFPDTLLPLVSFLKNLTKKTALHMLIIMTRKLR